MNNLDSFVINKGTVSKAEKQLGAKRPKLNSVTLIYVPLFFGGKHRGTIMGPAAVRVAELSDRLQSMGLEIHSEVEIKIPAALGWKSSPTKEPKCVSEIVDVCAELSEVVEAALNNNTVPITIGGDHSIAIGSKRLFQRFGFVQLLAVLVEPHNL